MWPLTKKNIDGGAVDANIIESKHPKTLGV